MSADRPDAGRSVSTDSLLYIPDDDLVRSIVEGDDADWSDARGYVPSDALISSVVRASSREMPRFKFPDWYATPRTDGNPVRVASAMFASLQLSPATLAAATVLHVVALVLLGPVAMGGPPEPPSEVASPSIPSPRLIYLVPRAPEATPRANETGVAVTIGRRGSRLNNRDSTARSAATMTEPPATSADSGARVEPRPESRELTKALDQEFRLGGDPLRVEMPDRERLLLLVRVLEVLPQVRVRVVGTGPAGPDAGIGARSGMREAESFARELIGLGVARSRIDLEASEEQGCPSSEPRCAADRRRVRTSIASRSPEPRTP